MESDVSPLSSAGVTEEEIEMMMCQICQLPFCKPKSLPCLHTFCKGCLSWHLQKHAVKAEAGTYCVFCPICKQVSDIPVTGVEGLQDNALMQRLLLAVQQRKREVCDICLGRPPKKPQPKGMPAVDENDEEEEKKEEDKDEEWDENATHCCVKCEEFLCEKCATMHKGTVNLSEHKILNITAIRELCHTILFHNMDKVAVRQLRKFGSHDNGLHNPTGMCVDKADDVLISNDDGTVVMFQKNGKIRKTINQKELFGSNESYLGNQCVAVTAEGYLATALRKDIGPQHANVAVIQSLADREIGVCTVKTKTPSECQPHGIAVTQDNHVVVTDIGRHCVYVFDPEFNMLRQFGKKGKRGGQFVLPYHVAVNADKDILVSDYGNHKVKVFSFKGKSRFSFGGMGTEEGQLTHPMGVCVDAYGHIFVADRDNHRVQLFNKFGQFMSVVVTDTCKDGLDIRPQDVSMTTTGHLAVLMRGIEGVMTSEIQVYQYGPSRWLQQGQLNLGPEQLCLLRQSVGSSEILSANRSPIHHRDPHHKRGMTAAKGGVKLPPISGITLPAKPLPLPPKHVEGDRLPQSSVRPNDPVLSARADISPDAPRPTSRACVIL